MVRVEFVDGTEEEFEEEIRFYYEKNTELFKLGNELFPTVVFPREFVKSIRVIEV